MNCEFGRITLARQVEIHPNHVVMHKMPEQGTLVGCLIFSYDLHVNYSCLMIL